MSRVWALVQEFNRSSAGRLHKMTCRDDGNEIAERLSSRVSVRDIVSIVRPR
jgi:hypothetical protein